MRLSFTKVFGLLLCIFYCQLVEAKIWRINNNAGVNADFAGLAAAFSNPALQNGDTIHIEGSSIAYLPASFSKRLVLIGPGYFLSGAGPITAYRQIVIPPVFRGCTWIPWLRVVLSSEFRVQFI